MVFKEKREAGEVALGKERIFYLFFFSDNSEEVNLIG